MIEHSVTAVLYSLPGVSVAFKQAQIAFSIGL
jgi:hypothetical protein